MAKVIVAVSNDLFTDQRVRKVSQSLVGFGFEVLTIGRHKKTSPVLVNYPCANRRFRLLFETGPLFYASLNIRFFIFLLFERFDVVHSNDLDTLPACFLAARIKRKKIVYDTHEYFTEVPELVNRPKVQRIWKRIEAWIFPKLEHIITVNKSIARLYEKEYGKKLVVLRNVPYKMNKLQAIENHQPIQIILQGNGINIHRGAEELILAMQLIDNVHLHIVGHGDVMPTLKQMVNENDLSSKVSFYGRLPFEQMMQITAACDVGVTLDRSTNINYLYSLPNKLFDYIQSGLAVVSSNLYEIQHIIDTYQCGIVINEVTPEHIADAIKKLQQNPEMLKLFKENSHKAAQQLNWENEEKELKALYVDLLSKS